MRGTAGLAALLVALALVSASTVTRGQPAIGVALDRYGTIAGATLLNQKCKYSSESLSAELEALVLTIRLSLELAIGNRQMLDLIEASAKKVADSEKYAACPKEAQKIVVDALLIARDWTQTIRQATIEGAARAGAPSSSQSAPTDPTRGKPERRMTNAEGLAYFTGSFIGVAQACGASAEIVAATDAKLTQLIRERAKTPDEVASAQRYKENGMQRGRQERVNGKCPAEGEAATEYLRNLGARLDESTPAR